MALSSPKSPCPTARRRPTWSSRTSPSATRRGGALPQVSVHYVGVALSTGREFDAIVEPAAAPSTSACGRRPRSSRAGDQGAWPAMRVGGRRRLVSRRTWATATAAAGGVIKPGETLVFVVDLLGTN